MFEKRNKADVAARIHFSLYGLCSEPDSGQTDVMRCILLISGVLVETSFLFEDPEEALVGALEKLKKQLECEPLKGAIHKGVMPPPTIIDFDTEQGRALAREFFEEWLDCPYDFFDLLGLVLHHQIISWEQYGFSRQESLRLIIECGLKAMRYELAAQDICDHVLDNHFSIQSWNLGDIISGLSGLAGYSLGLSFDGAKQCAYFEAIDLPDLLDQTTYVMTQEATRLGTPVGADWRFGLPANDVPINPPIELIMGLKPDLMPILRSLNLTKLEDQSVACAKAAGRMVAVACSGEDPQIEPVIAKPLAMAAMTESYKSISYKQKAAL